MLLTVLCMSLCTRQQHGGNDVVANGLALGPFIGYKWIASSRLTIDLQAGVGFLPIKAEDSAGNMESVSGVIPIANLNFGWSF